MVLIACDLVAGKGVDAILQFLGKADTFQRCIQMVAKRAPKAKGITFKTTTGYCHALHQTKSAQCERSQGTLTCLFHGNWFLNMNFEDLENVFSSSTNYISLSNISVNEWTQFDCNYRMYPECRLFVGSDMQKWKVPR